MLEARRWGRNQKRPADLIRPATAVVTLAVSPPRFHFRLRRPHEPQVHLQQPGSFDALERKLSMMHRRVASLPRLPLCGTTFPRPTPSPILVRSRALLGLLEPRRSACLVRVQRTGSAAIAFLRLPIVEPAPCVPLWRGACRFHGSIPWRDRAIRFVLEWF